MKDETYKEIQLKAKLNANRVGFDFESYGQATLLLCELILKNFAGYKISYTEALFLNSMQRELIRKDGRTPTKLGSQLLCEVYYKHSALQSDGCVWGQKYRCTN